MTPLPHFIPSAWTAFVRFQAVGLFAILAACAGTPGPPVQPAEQSEPLPELGPAELLIPTGASAVLVARPADIFASSPLRTVFEVLFPEQMRDSFARRTGVEPHELEQVVVGEYEGGYLAIARGPWPAADVVLGAEVRMNQVDFSTHEPWQHRTGWIGTERYELAAIRPHVILVSSGADHAAHSALHYARHGRYSNDEAAALASAAAPLLAEHRNAPVVIYGPNHLGLPDGFGASLLLARQEALALTLRASDASDDELMVTVDLRGTFPPDAQDNFRVWLESIADSDLGRALGIEEGIETLTIAAEENQVVVTLRLRAHTLAQGLLALFGGEMEQLLGVLPEKG